MNLDDAEVCLSWNCCTRPLAKGSEMGGIRHPGRGRLPLKPCLYCGAECNATWSPADAKADKFPACNWAHAYTALNLELVLPAWRGKC